MDWTKKEKVEEVEAVEEVEELEVEETLPGLEDLMRRGLSERLARKVLLAREV